MNKVLNAVKKDFCDQVLLYRPIESAHHRAIARLLLCGKFRLVREWSARTKDQQFVEFLFNHFQEVDNVRTN